MANLCYRLGYSCASIPGGKSQDQREESLRGFKAGDFDILVATDVAGRGIDVENASISSSSYGCRTPSSTRTASVARVAADARPPP